LQQSFESFAPEHADAEMHSRKAPSRRHQFWGVGGFVTCESSYMFQPMIGKETPRLNSLLLLLSFIQKLVKLQW